MALRRFLSIFVWVLVQGAVARAQSEYGNGYGFPKDQMIHLDGTRLGRCFYVEFRKYRDVVFPDVLKDYPDLEGYLRGDLGYQYSTGKEAALRRIILQQPPGSVDPFHVFAWSMDLHGGRLFEAVLAIHELLRNEARFYRDWISYPSTPELMRLFFNQFVDIRGDLEERGTGFHGDHRGSWYRIWGTMLDYLVAVMPSRECKGSACEVLNLASNLWLASVYGTFRAHAAEWIKPVIMYGHESDRRKIEVNQWGYDTMEGMVRASQELSLTAKQLDRYRSRCQSPGFYLRPGE